MAIFKPKPVTPTPVAPRPVAPKPVMGKPVMPGIKTPPPGLIGVPGKGFDPNMFSNGVIYDAPAKGPVGTSPAPMPTKGAHSSFYNSLMGGGAAPSRPAGPSLPVTGNKLNTAGFKNVAPVSFDMKKGGKVSSASKRADGIAQRGKTRA